MHRSGTVLLFAIGLVALATVLSFGFLRSMTTQRNSGHATTIKLLAMEAARTGTSHAIEQITRDYTANPITRMDGPARSVFRAHYKPFEMTQWENNVRDNRAINLHDVSSENYIYEPAWVELFWGSYSFTNGPGNGGNSVDGRGRWIEPELYADDTPVAVAANGTTWELPNAPVRFGDNDGEYTAGPGNWQDGDFDSVGVSLARSNNRDATIDVKTPLLNTASGSRCAPILFDKDFRRLPYTTRNEALTARQQARYRLRYAVLVRDLDGFLLLNPDPAIDWKKVVSPDPRDYAADPATQRIVRYMHACQNLMMGMDGFRDMGSATLGQRFAHVFSGRGWTTNYLRRSDADPLPRTFSLMYRMFDNRDWFRFLDFGYRWDWDRPNPAPFLAERIYGEPSQTGGPDGLVPNGAGDQRLRPDGGGWEWRHSGTGPLFSPIQGTKMIGGGGYKQDQTGEAQGNPYTNTVFGRGMSGSGNGRYGGPVDTPWSINVMTAPPNMLNALIYAYFPAGVVQAHYVAKPLGPPPSPDKKDDYKLDPASIDYWGALRGIYDLFNISHSDAFEHYQPPSRVSPAITPDYHQPSVFKTEPGYRFPQERYPGPLCFNGADPVSGLMVHDDYGRLIDLSEQDWGWDVHTGNRLAGPLEWGNPPGGVAANPPTDNGWSVQNQAGDDDWDQDKYDNGVFQGRNNRWWNRFSRDYKNKPVRPHDDSFWSDLLYAYNQALCVARGRQARFDGAYQPRANDVFHNPADPGMLCNDLASLDALFIRCLGHDPANPASAPPTTSDKQAWRKSWERYTPNNNIFTLNSPLLPGRTIPVFGITGGRPDVASKTDYVCDAAAQTQVLEMIVNDFRYSMFGSHPSYAAAFRPLDFNGDGKVACSGYVAVADPSPPPHDPTRILMLKAMLLDEVMDVVANGQGPAITQPFCMVGNLWIGRSRFWNVMVRGELYDNLAKQTVGQSTLETTLVVDPAQEAERGNAKKAYSTQVLFQHWYFNKYQGLQQRNF